MTDRPRRKHTEVLRHLLGASPLRLADVGCGQGGLARLLAKDGHRVVGVEPQAAAVRAAAQADTGARFLVGGGEALPLDDGSQDVVLLFNALHHVPVDWMDRAIAEAGRVLDAEGRLICVEPLAEGPVFELVKPVEDETEVRAAAEAALQRAAGSVGWQRTDRAEYLAPVRYESFQAFRDSLLAVDPRRADALAAHEAAMRAGFDAAARPEGGQYWLDQPTRLTVLQKTDRGD